MLPKKGFNKLCHLCACKTYHSDTELIKFHLFTPARHNLVHVSLSVSRALAVCWCVAVFKLSSFFFPTQTCKAVVQSLLSVLGSPLQVFMLKMWVSHWNAPSHPLMRRSGWLTLRTSHSSKSLRKAAARLTQRWPRIFFIIYSFIYLLVVVVVVFYQLKLNRENLHTTPSSSSALLKGCACARLRYITFTCSHAGMGHVTAPCAATFLLAVQSSKLILQEKLPCGLISQHESDSCVARQAWYTGTSCVYIFIYLFIVFFFLQPYSCQPSPWISNQFTADKKFILLFKIGFFFSALPIVGAVCKSLREREDGVKDTKVRGKRERRERKENVGWHSQVGEEKKIEELIGERS